MTVLMVAAVWLFVLAVLMDPPDLGVWPAVNRAGAAIGLGIGRAFCLPIHRYQAWLRAVEAGLPEALSPFTDDQTRWRYTPIVGVTSTLPDYY